MVAVLEHRGPDDFGYVLIDSGTGHSTVNQTAIVNLPCDVLLGSRRLSIVDRSVAGRQPMTNETQDIFLVLNGEIYNHQEIRRELIGRGHRFTSSSDTEVVVHAYEEFGTDCVRRFNGMWAFALWDQARRRLFCSRDRFGVKPFYYYVDDEMFVFGSEIKAILEAVPARRAPHWPSILAYLTPGALCDTEDTFFDRIKRLPAAHNLIVTRDDARQARYWDYSSRSHAYDDGRPEETFAELFDDAVRVRLPTDVPVGVALSGGIDSTSVTAVARRHVGSAPLPVFTAEFPGTAFDERHYAELASKWTGAELHTVAYRPIRLVDDLSRVIWHMDYPSLEAQVLPRWHLMSLAARHVKVVLEGQGSDELLAGYPFRYFPHYVLDELGHLRAWGATRRLARLSWSTVRMTRRFGLAAIPHVVGRVYPRLAWVRRWTRTQDCIVSRELRELLPSEQKARVARGPYADHLTNALHADHSRHILPHLLKFGDAISMGHSVETRLPFLDYRLVEFAFQLPAYEKFDGATSKVVLKGALREVLPPEILERSDKMGFETPVGEWLRVAMDREVRPLLLSHDARTRHVFDRVHLEKVLGRLAAGDTSIGPLVFRWLSLEIWFRLFIEGMGIPGAAVAAERWLDT